MTHSARKYIAAYTKNMRIFLPFSLALVLIFNIFPATSAQAAGNERIYFYGDSIAAESFPYFKQAIKTKISWPVIDRSIPGSSPCDWYTRLSSDMKTGSPRLVSIESFGNNLSRCQLRNGVRAGSGSSLYWQRYQSDLDNLVSRVPSDVPVIISPAAAARNDLSAGVSHKARMLSVMRLVASLHSNVRIVDAGAAVEGPGGKYTYASACLANEPCLGQPTLGQNIMHAHDGLHFCPAITNATVELLRHCPVYASGAWRFANSQAEAALLSIS